jgi:hypothetical protein
MAGEPKRPSKNSPAGPETGGSFARPNQGFFIITQTEKQNKKGAKAYGKTLQK